MAAPLETVPSRVAVPASALGEALAARGFTGPVLVVADDAAIAADAPAWASSFAAARMPHRVVVAGVDVVAAAAGLDARVVVAVGAAALPAAAIAAAALRLPLVEAGTGA